MRVHPGGKGLEMGQNALDRLVALGSAPLGGQGLPEVLLKGPGQAGCPASRWSVPSSACRAQKQAQVAALHLLRRRTGGDGMLQILLDPPSQACPPARCGTSAPEFFRAVFWGTLHPLFPASFAPV